MNQAQIGGLLLVAGFIFILAASLVGPPRLYQEPDVNRQLELIAGHSTAWIASNVFFGLAGLITAAGLALFAMHLRGSENAWLAAAGAGVYLLGAIVYAIFLYRRTIEPAALFANYAFSPLTVVLLGSLVIGLLLFGVFFLRTGYPVWLGVGTTVGMVLIGGAAFFFPAQFFQFFPPQALFLFTLAAGIVMLRR